MTLALTDFAFVVRPGVRVAQSREGRQEHRAFQLLVSASRRQFAADGRARSARDRGESGISGQMRRRRKGAARHIDQESRSGPNPDSWHAGQDRMKRVCKHEALNLFRYFVALYAQSRQLSRQARQNDACRLSSQNNDRLLTERLNDFGSPSLAHTRSEFDQPIRQLFLAERRELRRRRISLEQIKHGGVSRCGPITRSSAG